MQRREMLSTLAGAGAGGAAGILSAATSTWPQSAKPTSTKRAVAPFVQAPDGTQLYWTQWGEGRPILFLNSANLTTQMWDYQMVAFAAQGTYVAARATRLTDSAALLDAMGSPTPLLVRTADRRR